MTTRRYDFKKQDLQTHECGATLEYISSTKYKEEGSGLLHTHPFTELFYVTKGKGQYQIEHTYYSVEAGDLLLLRSNVAHAEVSLAANPMECIVLGFSAANALPDLLTPNVFRVLHLDSSANQIQSYLSLMLQEVTKRRPRYAEVCQHLFEALLIQLIREFSPILLPIDKDAPLSKKAKQIKEFIEKHYLENITLESLAQQAQVSKYYLAHTFEQYYKISPMQYVQSLRLNEAKTLLRTTNIPTRRIASIVGYSTHGYFNQRFVKFEGMTPTEYRNMMQEGFQKDEHAAPLPEESIGTDNE